ncbi:Metalloenzyme, LuxS/M16 peptidase-like protein [Ochromonadaceae sp. CCMP2298]|nr:Metalloenzyme, LuxS/M16 peptidase-like protein [Ochromonadaceae sp. CCMP2298]
MLLSSVTANELEKPQIDDRLFHQFTLSNGIKATVVQDKTSEKASGSLSVRTGAANDPLPGIAHITEHAVFLGSVKYPLENAYKDFLNKNGGGSNAATGMEQTTYKFNINADAFPHALDIFSQFFKGPLLSTEAISREVMAVDAEDSKNRIIDGRRSLQVLKHQIRPSHNYAKFSTGNLKTLAFGDVARYGENLSNVIRAFHQIYYRPENMCVALAGPQGIADLARLAEEHFGGIKVADNSITGDREAILASVMDFQTPPQMTALGASVATTSLFKHGGGKLIRIKPVRDLHDISIMWELPASRHMYRQNPCSLLGFLIGHKGEGSWFSKLQDLGWATGTSAGMRTTFTDFTLFEAFVALTEEGVEHWEEVLQLLFETMKVIAGTSDEALARIWSEMRTINALDFSFQEKNTVYELANELASSMHEYDPKHILSAGWLLDETVDLPLMRQWLAMLQPETGLCVQRSSKFGAIDSTGTQMGGIGTDDAAYLDTMYKRMDATGAGLTEQELDAARLTGKYFELLAESDSQIGVTQVEPFYGVPYLIQPLPLEKLATGGVSDIRLPGENLFICTDLIGQVLDTTPKPLRSQPPVRLEVEGEVWFSPDQVFRQPRAVVFNLLLAPSCADGHPVLSLISQVFSQVVARRYYQASQAGLSYSFSLGPRGVGLSFFGYHSRLSVLAGEVSADVGSMAFWQSVDPKVIQICKERILRTLRSTSKERPDSQADTLLRYALQEGAWLPSQRLAAMEGVDRDYFLSRIAALKYTRMVSYTHSHERSTPEDAVATRDALMRNMDIGENAASISASAPSTSASAREFPDERARLLDVGHTVLALPSLNKDDPNSALVTYMQADSTNPRNSALLLVLRRLLAEPAFAELRTKKQLGYIVSLSSGGYGRGYGSVRGIVVRILSQRFSPLVMEKELGAFLDTQRGVMAALQDAEVSELSHSIVRSILDPPTTYSEEGGEFWNAIVNEMPFDWTEQVIQALKSLTAQDVIAAAEGWIFDASRRKSLSTMVFGPPHQGELEALKKAQTGSTDIDIPEVMPQATVTEIAGTVTDTEVTVADITSSPLGDSAGAAQYHFTIEQLEKFRDALELYDTK